MADQLTITPEQPAQQTNDQNQNLGQRASVSFSPEDSKQILDETREAPADDTSTERPEWLPEKFKSPEEMAKAYVELEKKLGGQKPEKQAPPPQQGDLPATLSEYIPALEKEFMEKGALSEESYAALQSKYNVPKELADEFIENRVERVDRQTQELFNEVGGKDNYERMASWATENLSREEIEAFNNSVNSGSVAQAKLAIAGLNQKFNSANGSLSTGKLSGESRETAPGARPFASLNEYLTALRDPRYGAGDPAYHKAVEERLKVSNI